MYIYGKNAVREHILEGKNANKAIISKNFKDQDLINIIKNKGIKINFVDNKIIDYKIKGLHQGIVLEIDDYKTYKLEDIIENINKKYKTLIMLDHLEDPHNFGAIIRTCEALGVDGIIIPSDRQVQINSTVIKTSVGAIEHIPIIKVPNLTATIKKLKNNDYWIIGTDMKGQDYSKFDYNMNICLIIGNEGNGISQIIRKNCDFIAKIPMKGKINSLNASVSAGIIIAEIFNKRGE